MWIRQRKLPKREAFIICTLERLRWEAKFLESEWFIRGNRGNREIFPPDTTDSRVLEAVLELEQMAPFQLLPT